MIIIIVVTLIAIRLGGIVKPPKLLSVFNNTFYRQLLNSFIASIVTVFSHKLFHIFITRTLKQLCNYLIQHRSTVDAFRPQDTTERYHSIATIPMPQRNVRTVCRSSLPPSKIPKIIRLVMPIFTTTLRCVCVESSYASTSDQTIGPIGQLYRRL